MNREQSSTKPRERSPEKGKAHGFSLDFHGVRYQVKNVGRAVEFYTRRLGFKLEHQRLPAFANAECGAPGRIS